jgi:hypothetical protein
MGRLVDGPEGAPRCGTRPVTPDVVVRRVTAAELVVVATLDFSVEPGDGGDHGLAVDTDALAQLGE